MLVVPRTHKIEVGNRVVDVIEITIYDFASGVKPPVESVFGYGDRWFEKLEDAKAYALTGKLPQPEQNYVHVAK